MIVSFKHKGLKKLFEQGETKGVMQEHVDRLRDILATLNSARLIDDLNAPGLKLHQLKGSEKGIWSVSVRGNWRVTFRFKDGDTEIVDYRDYH